MLATSATLAQVVAALAIGGPLFHDIEPPYEFPPDYKAIASSMLGMPGGAPLPASPPASPGGGGGGGASAPLTFGNSLGNPSLVPGVPPGNPGSPTPPSWVPGPNWYQEPQIASQPIPPLPAAVIEPHRPPGPSGHSGPVSDVPEPSTLVLGGVALFLLGLVLLRRPAWLRTAVQPSP